jgi:glucosyl-3-phosphoglycerate synthase
MGRMLQPVVSVVLPARDEAATIGPIVRAIADLRRSGTGITIGEIVVVDDGSTDGTVAVAAAAGARVVPAADVLADVAAGPGKGQAMWKGLAETSGDVVVFCDADLEAFDPAFISGLVDALVAEPHTAMAKARYRRAGTGGRVNELVARPVLDLLHPALGHIAQPLGGEYAAWRDVLEQVPFVEGYGVDLGLLLDVAQRFGAESIVEADLGVRVHRNRSLDELRPQARAVLEVALQRAGLLVDAAFGECPRLADVAGYERKTA